MDKDLIKEYHDRNIRWTAESLKQLSFYNNLLLTLSVGFLSFSFKPEVTEDVYLTATQINWPIMLRTVSLTLMVISVLTGLILVINRLQDFRLTRQVNQTRQRMFEHSGVKLDQKTPDKFTLVKRIILIFQSYPVITIEDCKNYKNSTDPDKERIKSNFRTLRNISHNLGLNTWRNTKLQTLYFGLGIIAYLLSFLSN